MGYTKRDFPVMEVACAVTHGGTLASGHKRHRVGDIVAVRQPYGGVGLKEMQSLLWFRAEGLEENEWGLLTMPLYSVEFDATNPRTVEGTDVSMENKHRFKVDLDRIVELYPYIDLARIADPTDLYQPFIQTDNGVFSENDYQAVINTYSVEERRQAVLAAKAWNQSLPKGSPKDQYRQWYDFLPRVKEYRDTYVDGAVGLFLPDSLVPVVDICEVVFDRQTMNYLNPDILREVAAS